MSTNELYILLEMTDEPDCRFVATWLLKAAEAQTFWSQALNDPSFANSVTLLHADGIPDLAAAALELFGELEHRHHVAALDLGSDDCGLFCRELGLLVQLGFFINVGTRYWMAVPEQVTLEAVKLAALNVESTADAGDEADPIKPEEQLHTFSSTEAEALRSKLMITRRSRADTSHGKTLQ